LDPAGADESVYSEQTIRLPETYWCYGVAGPAPDPSPPPAATMGHVTFGCLNNFAKVSPPALDLWAQILQEVPRSRLIVHSHPGAHLDGVRKRFAGKGISPDRLEFPSQQPWPEYMRTYGRIDIAVDPFPWGGGITTCEALWMGVPVVSLAGRTAVGRGGASILANVGVPELVARTPQQYVQIAAALAGDLPRLGELRRTLRGRMQASPLMDAPRFARNIEAAYRQMWRNWCERGGNSSLQCPDDAVQQFLHAALAQYRAGNSLAAEKLCRQVLSLEPNNVDALNLLGGCLFQIGNLNEAIEVYQRIAALKPDLPEVHNNLGGCLQRSGRLVDAIAAFKTAIKLKPDFPVAISNLVAAYLEWGNALSAKGQTAEALEAFQQAVALKPDFIEALDKIGQCLQLLENLDGAIAAFQTIIRLKPDTFEAFNNLGIALQGRAQLDEAIACFRQAVRLKPDLAEAHNNLGNALRAKGQVDGAIVALREAVRLKPAFADAHSNLGVALTELGQLHEAIAAYRRAIELKSDFAQAHWNYALLLLMLGVFEEGWKEFEWGLRVRRLRLGRDLPQPRWTGQDAPGKTILLVSDGRFGDAMHFIRYAPLVAERGATVLLECQTELAPLLNRVQGISAVFVRGEQLPEFHWQTPLLSLPLVFGTTMKTIPADVPYLSAPPDRIEQWAKRLAGDSSFKVGLAWAGSARRDARSCPLETFAPLAAVPGVTFYGLQKGPEANQPVPPGLRLIQMGDELHDFADTAALVSNLDLVISVDTSVAHLTGGMGRPVWTLIPFNPGFQWLRDRADSPWYPTMRLFRQTTPGDWLDVVRRVAQHLEMSKRKT
jgi:predicted O-linked N-acetylglucosamine transferase (SPINDLY family)